MERQASGLADYVEERVGEALRGVGYHTAGTHGIVYLRDDVSRIYPADRVERFIEVSRRINASVGTLDEMGRPEASLHALEDGYIIQFHLGPGEVVFLSIDHDVGRQLSRFLDDCLDQLS